MLKLIRRGAVVLGGLGLLALGAPAALAQSAAGTSVTFWGTFAGSNLEHSSPVTVSLPVPVAEVATSNSAVYALLANGSVYAWGMGTYGQLGDGGTANSLTTPVQVEFPAGVTIVSLSVNSGPWNSAFAIDTTGHVWGWGANGSNDFCLGKSGQHDTPVELPFTDVTAVAGAADHATYDAGGVLYSCGMGVYGELGDGSTITSKVPVRVTGLSGATVTALTAGFGTAGALLADGAYYDWGENNLGQLGDGTTQDSDVPVQVKLPGAVSQAFAGGNDPEDGQTLVRLASGTVYAWGADESYQLGDDKTANEPSPVEITPPAGVIYEAVASGGDTSYGVSAAGNVYAWGGADAGALGDGSTGTARTPVKVESGASTLISGTSHVVAVALSG